MPANPRIHIRKLARQRLYYITLHADEEMDEDGITQYELEKVLMEGEIVSHQIDALTGERKYVLTGLNIGLPIEVVVKISHTDEIVVIAVYSL